MSFPLAIICSCCLRREVLHNHSSPQGFPAFSSTCVILGRFVFPCRAGGVICVTEVVDLIYITNLGFLLSDL